MGKVSVIVPSLLCRYASRTVEDILKKAKGDIEVIVILDDYIPDPPIKNHPKLTVIHKGRRTGLRESVNMGARLATGKYIMKCDDHCMFAEGFDLVLKEHSQNNWLQVPSRHSIKADDWTIARKFPTEYEYMGYPYSSKRGIGLFAKKWWGEHGNDPKNTGIAEFWYREWERADIKIDDIMCMQGSCWFMETEHFKKIGGLCSYSTMYGEPQELILKTWLSGGRCVVNKNTYYAHMYKGDELSGQPHEREYRLNLNAMRETERYVTWYWMTDQWTMPSLTGRPIRRIKWLIEKFWPIPDWPENWEEERDLYYQKYGIPREPVGGYALEVKNGK